MRLGRITRLEKMMHREIIDGHAQRFMAERGFEPVHACGLREHHAAHSWLTLGTPFYCSGAPDYRIAHEREAV